MVVKGKLGERCSRAIPVTTLTEEFPPYRINIASDRTIYLGNPGETYQIVASVGSPLAGSLRYVSKNETFATVSDTGLITLVAEKPGTGAVFVRGNNTVDLSVNILFLKFNDLVFRLDFEDVVEIDEESGDVVLRRTPEIEALKPGNILVSNSRTGLLNLIQSIEILQDVVLIQSIKTTLEESADELPPIQLDSAPYTGPVVQETGSNARAVDLGKKSSLKCESESGSLASINILFDDLGLSFEDTSLKYVAVDDFRSIRFSGFILYTVGLPSLEVKSEIELKASCKLDLLSFKVIEDLFSVVTPIGAEVGFKPSLDIGLELELSTEASSTFQPPRYIFKREFDFAYEKNGKDDKGSFLDPIWKPLDSVTPWEVSSSVKTELVVNPTLGLGLSVTVGVPKIELLECELKFLQVDLACPFTAVLFEDGIPENPTWNWNATAEAKGQIQVGCFQKIFKFFKLKSTVSVLDKSLLSLSTTLFQNPSIDLRDIGGLGLSRTLYVKLTFPGSVLLPVRPQNINILIDGPLGTQTEIFTVSAEDIGSNKVFQISKAVALAAPGQYTAQATYSFIGFTYVSSVLSFETGSLASPIPSPPPLPGPNSCSVQDVEGQCITLAECSGKPGYGSAKGFCPDDADDIFCCVNIPCLTESGPGICKDDSPVSYTHLTLPTTPYV